LLLSKDEKMDDDFYEENEEDPEYDNEQMQEDNLDDEHKNEGNEDFLLPSWNYMFK